MEVSGDPEDSGLGGEEAQRKWTEEGMGWRW